MKFTPLTKAQKTRRPTKKPSEFIRTWFNRDLGPRRQPSGSTPNIKGERYK